MIELLQKSLHGQYINRIIQAGKLEKLEQVIETDEILNRKGDFVEPQRELKINTFLMDCTTKSRCYLSFPTAL